MNKWLRRVASFLLLAITLAALLVLWANHELSRPLMPDEADPRLDLAPGTGFSAVTAQLARDGIIDYPPRLLDLYARLSGKASQIRAGEYAFRPGMNSYDLLDLLLSGDVIRYRVTLVEGKTYRDALKALAAHKKLQASVDPSQPLWPQLGVDAPLAEHPEGLFFPDTYSFVKGDTDVSILQRAYWRMLEILDREWVGRAEGLPYENPYQALIMASIVEKETGHPDERERIAGVFISRLQRNMRLQTDPTVIYGLGEAYEGNLRRRHLQDDSNRYNTYRQHGLPPTPIALPGWASIHAALNPLQDGSLYFVARGDGSHQFSKSLEEHQQAVRDYQLRRRDDYRSSPQPVAPKE